MDALLKQKEKEINDVREHKDKEIGTIRTQIEDNKQPLKKGEDQEIIPHPKKVDAYKSKIASLKSDMNYIQACASEKYDKLEKKFQDSQWNCQVLK